LLRRFGSRDGRGARWPTNCAIKDADAQGSIRGKEEGPSNCLPFHGDQDSQRKHGKNIEFMILVRRGKKKGDLMLRLFEEAVSQRDAKGHLRRQGGGDRGVGLKGEKKINSAS